MKDNSDQIGDTSHQSAKPTHYDGGAESYDTFNEERSKTINRTIENILKKHKAKEILDLSCGTGSQVFWLAKEGFDVIGSDINAKMLGVAEGKAAKHDLNVMFIESDMRKVSIDKPVDAAISIFNSIGHLTVEHFEEAAKNTYGLLNDKGLFIFDIFNLDYLTYEDRITKLTIDWLKDAGAGRKRNIQFSTIQPSGVLASYTTSILYRSDGSIKSNKSKQTLQVYTADQLVKILDNCGFDTLEQTDVDGSCFDKHNTERILTVARKRQTLL